MFPSGCVVCDATGGPRNAERESVVGRAEARIDRPQPAIERVVRRCRAAELGEQHASHRPPRDDRRRRADLEVREDPVPPHRAVKDEQVAAGAQRAQRWRQARDVRRVHDRHASARQPPRERRAISRVWHRERRDPPAPPRACGSRRHRDELDACEAPEPGPQDAHGRARRHHRHRVRPHPIEDSDPAAGIAVRVGEQHEIDAIGGLTREVTRDVDQDRAASLGDQERALHAARPPASRAPAGGTCAEEAHGDHLRRPQQLACQGTRAAPDRCDGDARVRAHTGEGQARVEAAERARPVRRAAHAVRAPRKRLAATGPATGSVSWIHAGGRCYGARGRSTRMALLSLKMMESPATARPCGNASRGVAPRRIPNALVRGAIPSCAESQAAGNVTDLGALSLLAACPSRPPLRATMAARWAPRLCGFWSSWRTARLLQPARRVSPRPTLGTARRCSLRVRP